MNMIYIYVSIYIHIYYKGLEFQITQVTKYLLPDYDR